MTSVVGRTRDRGLIATRFVLLKSFSFWYTRKNLSDRSVRRVRPLTPDRFHVELARGDQHVSYRWYN